MWRERPSLQTYPAKAAFTAASASTAFAASGPPARAISGCPPPAPQISHNEFIRDSRLTSFWGLKTSHHLNIIP